MPHVILRGGIRCMGDARCGSSYGRCELWLAGWMATPGVVRSGRETDTGDSSTRPSQMRHLRLTAQQICCHVSAFNPQLHPPACQARGSNLVPEARILCPCYYHRAHHSMIGTAVRDELGRALQPTLSVEDRSSSPSARKECGLYVVVAIALRSLEGGRAILGYRGC